ncbi:endonuclease III [Lichenibacterium dinghuense]|uniref:endonuclease III n=1 Tax=Lichenibacterium dinghuense TaxID=2895977 RepID=UPI001F0251D1|nr:endonuclease III [Lichenibacterium sp. 6Y81]
MARKKPSSPGAAPSVAAAPDIGAPGGQRPVAAAVLDDAHEAGRVGAIFARLRAANPEPKTELAYSSPFTLLVAVVLSAQATDVSVNKATGPLFAVADTPEAILALGEERLRDFVKTIGLYNSKAKNVMALCGLLVERHGGAVPRDRALLEALPGVGRKTANVVLNTIWGDPVIAVDTHVFRVSNRLAIAPGATPLAVELGLEKAIPAEFMRDAHHWMILHGRYTCVARRPLCAACPVSDLCPWPEKSA